MATRSKILHEGKYSANSILKADSANATSALTVAEQTIVGRITSGVIDDLSATQVRTLLNVEDGADVTDAGNVASTIHAADQKGGSYGDLADADEVGLVDSAASYVLKRLTWANIKATLLTWLRTSPIIPINAPSGFLINGKIVPSVSSNNLTVAIKGLDGNDPSASNPVYCRIGDTVRSITSALSVTKNAGTNWCNAGSSELATKEIDYFVYLGYNATDGVVIGFSRIPYANEYDDFSTTTTNEKYCAISTITNAAAGDDYAVVGRFAATLSAGAGYTWTVPTFTSKNLIQRPLFESRVLSFTPTITSEFGTPTTTSSTAFYRVRYLSIFVRAYVSISNKGTADGTLIMSIPFNPPYIHVGIARENSANGKVIGVHSGTSSVSCRYYDNSTPWVNGNFNLGIEFSLT